MNSPHFNLRTPLLRGISQFDVDFVIPRIGVDIPLGIDPFLLYKSRDPAFTSLHNTILMAFNTAIGALRDGNLSHASYLFNFPEVPEIGLGYTAKSKRGSGVGDYLSRLIIETLKDSPALLERGVRHIEEMQLVSIRIEADRTSDIAANLIKQFLIEYTQKQSRIWNLPVRQGVPVNHIFDPNRLEWYDDYCDLPISEYDESPIILVPRRIVRTLPWINYADYFRMEFSAYLRAKRVKAALNPLKDKHKQESLPKSQVIAITRTEIERIDRYINIKEATAEQARPSLIYLDKGEADIEAESLKEQLSKIVPGTTDAHKYQLIVLEILNYLFNPELIGGEIEVRTYDSTERRDIVFTNDSDESFWSYLRNEHSSFLLMFETKNVNDLEPAHFNQVATYLGDRLGRLGFIVTRNVSSEANQRKVFSIYNDSSPRKIILVLSDGDLRQMLDMKCREQNPMRFIQSAYRKFRQTVQ